MINLPVSSGTCKGQEALEDEPSEGPTAHRWSNMSLRNRSNPTGWHPGQGRQESLRALANSSRKASQTPS